MYIGPNIEREDGQKADQEGCCQDNNHGAVTAPAKAVFGPTNDHLAQRQPRCQGGEIDQQEENKRPDGTAGQLAEGQGQGGENKPRTGGRVQRLAEDDGKHPNARQKRDCRIGQTDNDGGFTDIDGFIEIGAIGDEHGRPDADREETLTDRRLHDLGGDFGKIGREQISQGGTHIAGNRPINGDKHEHDHERGHENKIGTLQPGRKMAHQNQRDESEEQDLVKNHLARIGQ